MDQSKRGLADPTSLRELANNIRRVMNATPVARQDTTDPVERIMARIEEQRATIYAGLAVTLEACADRIEEAEAPRHVREIVVEEIARARKNRISTNDLDMGVDEAVATRSCDQPRGAR